MRRKQAFKAAVKVKAIRDDSPGIGLVRKPKTQTVRLQGQGVRLTLSELPYDTFDELESVEISVIRMKR